MSVTRIFVEKKPGFDVEAKHIQTDLTENLGIRGIEELRLLHRYDVEGLSQKEQEDANRMIFSEPNVDHLYGEDLQFSDDYHVFAMEYLPGQYDQRADSAAQCVQLLTHGERPKVAMLPHICKNPHIFCKDPFIAALFLHVYLQSIIS